MSDSNGELPDDWGLATLGELGDVIRGVSYKKHQVRDKPAEGFVPLLRATNIGDVLTYEDLVYVPRELVKPVQLLEVADVVIAASSGSLKVVGKAAPVQEPWEGTFGAFCAVFRPRTGVVDRDYLSWFMASPAYRNRVSQLAAGNNINNLKRDHILSMPMPLPPMEKQRRIAAELNDLMLLANEGGDAFSRALVGVTAYRNACLGEAFPLNATTLPLGDVAVVQSGIAKGRPKDGDQVELPYIRTANVQALRLDLSQVKTLLVTTEQQAKYLLQRDDVLVLEGGDADKVGRGWLWSGEVPNCLHQNHVFAVRPNPELVLPRYLAYFINAPQARRYFLSVANQVVNLASINKRNLKMLPVPVPPPAEQEGVVRRLDAQLLASAELESSLHARSMDGDAFKLALLHGAFIGPSSITARKLKDDRAVPATEYS